MAERFKRTYISAREFVNSWEKEIYELNNLDYFIFLIMNDLGTLIEQKFFKEIDRKETLFLNSEEISNLVFNLGDSLQMFFEKNCFGACTLRCPSRLNENLNQNEQQLRQEIISVFDNRASNCQKKEQCLYLDLMNYVVLDTLIDFYSYELNIVFDESDLNLLQFAEFIMEIILDLISHKGQHLLARPQENAGGLFEDSLKNDETPWSEVLPDMDEDEDDISEMWKNGDSHVTKIFADFREHYASVYDEDVLKAIQKFEEYLIDFLEIKNFEEVDVQDLEEFFTVILVNELVDQDESLTNHILELFRHLFNHIEFQYECEIRELFDSSNFNSDDFRRVTSFNRKYQARNPLIHYLLSGESQNDTQVEGFYEVVNKSGSFFVLRDLHLNTVFQPVDFDVPDVSTFYSGDILHAQINLEQTGWRISRLEMLYPPQSKPYLL